MPGNVAETCLAREDLYRLLSACYYQPSAEFAEEHLFDHLQRAAELYSPRLAELAGELRRAFAETDLATLVLDYSRLFLGPFEIPAKPYGSVWLEGEKVVMGETTQQVLACYGAEGFALDDNFREVPDHIAVELEFLYLLSFRENEARLQEQKQLAWEKIDQRHRFLADHLGRWIGPFATALRKGAQSAYFIALADLTETFLGLELQEAEPAVPSLAR